MLLPRETVPALEVPTVGGGTWKLGQTRPETFSMVVFYRGLHCPICSKYLGDLNAKLDEFEKLGVEVVVISSDTEERAARAKEEWQLDRLILGYGLPIETARAWGLYVSGGIGKTSAGIEEPSVFSEPGLFLVRPDGTLFAASVQTMPFARPSFREILGALDFIIQRNYPARGELKAAA